jgi:uncharacterized membrane protein YfcA
VSGEAAAIVLGGAFAGGFVSGLAGFGTGLVALGIWLHALQPAAAASLVVVCSVVAQTLTLPAIWHAIHPGRVWPFVAFGLLGVPVGTVLLRRLDPEWFKLCTGLLLVAFSAFLLLSRRPLRLRFGGRAADGLVGFAGGVLGGMAGLSGPLPTMWASVRGWGKDERRGVFQAFNLSVLAAALLAHAASGLLTAEVGRLVLLALPGTAAGAWLGARAYRRLSDRRFHEVVLALLLASGLFLVWGALGA